MFIEKDKITSSMFLEMVQEQGAKVYYKQGAGYESLKPEAALQEEKCHRVALATLLEIADGLDYSDLNYSQAISMKQWLISVGTSHNEKLHNGLFNKIIAPFILLWESLVILAKSGHFHTVLDTAERLGRKIDPYVSLRKVETEQPDLKKNLESIEDQALMDAEKLPVEFRKLMEQASEHRALLPSQVNDSKVMSQLLSDVHKNHDELTKIITKKYNLFASGSKLREADGLVQNIKDLVTVLQSDTNEDKWNATRHEQILQVQMQVDYLSDSLARKALLLSEEFNQKLQNLQKSLIESEEMINPLVKTHIEDFAQKLKDDAALYVLRDHFKRSFPRFDTSALDFEKNDDQPPPQPLTVDPVLEATHLIARIMQGEFGRKMTADETVEILQNGDVEKAISLWDEFNHNDVGMKLRAQKILSSDDDKLFDYLKTKYPKFDFADDFILKAAKVSYSNYFPENLHPRLITGGGGLANLACTCYFNSSIQILRVDPLFRQELLLHAEMNVNPFAKQFNDLLTLLDQGDTQSNSQMSTFFDAFRNRGWKPPYWKQEDGSECIGMLLEYAGILRKEVIISQTRKFCDRIEDPIELKLTGFEVMPEINKDYDETEILHPQKLLEESFFADQMTVDNNSIVSTLSKKLDSQPESFDFYFKRFIGTKKNPAPLNFTTPITLDSQQYEPYAVQCQYGATIKSGHYNALIKHDDGQWYLYDDSTVSTTPTKDVNSYMKAAVIVKYRKI